MSHCFSVGFKDAILDASPATSTVVIAASAETRPSLASLKDNNWDSFQRNYIAALGIRDVTGVLVGVPRQSEHYVTFREAFEHASICTNRNIYDSPELAARPEWAADQTLTEPPDPGSKINIPAKSWPPSSENNLHPD
jgi:hypothetical protein